MKILPKSIEELIDGISSLPGIGPKSASRIAFFLLRAPKELSDNLSTAITQARDGVKLCKECYHYSDEEICPICSSDERDKSVIMLVEDALDLLAIEKTGDFEGVYFVLGGILSPMNGIGPDEIRLKELLDRLKKSKSKSKEIELIIGLNPNMEGESTALYIQKEIDANKDLRGKVKITKLARGLSSGADIDYLDEYTIRKAFEGRSAL
ncbi:recombination protein RecR [Candidatus Dojkabacteria bacterium]|nr:recombination protein RecR [Candidatus Dojkabacteria bacterium]